MSDNLPSRRRALCGYSVEGFSLVELLVVISIIMLLIAIAVPTIRKARDLGETAKCLSNLRQVGLAISQYAIDHRGCLVPGDYVGITDGFEQPGAGSWADILVDGKYISSPVGTYPADKLYAEFPDGMEQTPTILRCPSGQDQNAVDNYPTSQTDPRGSFYFVRGSDTTHQAVFTWYAVNSMPRLPETMLNDTAKRPLPFNFLPDYTSGKADWKITRLSRLKPTVPLIFDGVWCFNGDAARINARHNNHRDTNVLFADGHCDSVVSSTLPNGDWYLR